MAPQERSYADHYGGEEDNAVDIEDSRGVRFHADHMADMAPLRRTSTIRRESFIAEFATSKGAPQIVFLVMLVALGFGSTVGVVPAVMTDRYARLNHGYNDSRDCASFKMNQKPDECLLGSADAQSAVAVEQFISDMLTFFSSSLVGSLSDEYGRKGILVLGVFLSVLSPLCLVLIQTVPSMSPVYYYIAGASTGLVNYIAVALSSLSDVMPPRWRAPSFGLVLAGFSVGFAVAPTLALLMGHFAVSIFALTVVSTGLLTMIFFFPETLPEERSQEARRHREEQMEGLGRKERVLWILKRPIYELSILNRSRIFRLLSCLAFFSGIVSSGDQTLLFYYLEDRIGFNDSDIAIFFFILGMLGIFVQGFIIKLLNESVGERKVVMISFAIGCVHNVMYGVAKSKTTIFISGALGSLVSMAFPTISAIKSNNVDESEQGRIQGALYSLQALASASGPTVMRIVYGYTKDGAFLGPGSMFVVGGFFYLIAVFFACALPPEADSKGRETSAVPDDTGPRADSPLLPNEPSSRDESHDTT